MRSFIRMEDCIRGNWRRETSEMSIRLLLFNDENNVLVFSLSCDVKASLFIVILIYSDFRWLWVFGAAPSISSVVKVRSIRITSVISLSVKKKNRKKSEKVHWLRDLAWLNSWVKKWQDKNAMLCFAKNYLKSQKIKYFIEFKPRHVSLCYRRAVKLSLW